MFSCYANPTELTKILIEMKKYKIKMLRLSFNPSYIRGVHPYQKETVQYFLDNTPNDNIVIVDRNHLYTSGQSGNEAQFKDNKAKAYDHLREVCEDFYNNPRVWIETLNEYPGLDQRQQHQNLVNYVKSKCNNPVGFNKFRSGWYNVTGAAFAGDHYYFNHEDKAWTVEGALRDVAAGISRGYKIINTEVGASWKEAPGFTSVNVGRLNSFLKQSYALGAKDCVWQRYGIQNLSAYENFGLTFPYDKDTENNIMGYIVIPILLSGVL